MSLKLKIRYSILALLLMLLLLGGYAFFIIGRLERATQYLPQDYRLERGGLLAFLALSTVVGIVFSIRLPRQVVRPLRRLTADVERVAGPGPATRVAITKNDEVGTVAAAVNRVLVQAQQEQRGTQTELLMERNRLETLVVSLDEGLLLLDQKGTILLANPAACELLGTTAPALLGQNASKLAENNTLLRELLIPVHTPHRMTEVLRGPTFAVPRHGGEQHYQLTVSPILAINEFTLMQESAGHILCLRNVSDFKKLDQVKSQFLATISHELKTPLSSIKLSLMLLQNERTGAEERQRLAAGIRDETQRLLDMVGQLIDVSRLDAGAGIKLNPQAVHLADVVQYALDTVAPQLQDKQLQVDVQVADTLPAVQGDLEKTTWVLINLLSNAVRYSPPGAPLIIRGGLWGEMVRLSVQDQGPGIPPQYHKRIFERFAGVPNSAAHAGSSGLGLHISHEFIVAQGGQLWVESKPDCGSCFIFTLPVVVETSLMPVALN